ncbi:S8 family serine peptidase [Kaarinaea lacus]
MQIKRKLLTYSVAAGLGISANAVAGTVDPELAQLLSISAPDDSIAIIVEMADKFDIKVIRKSGAQGRAELVRGLKGKAAAAQQPINALLARNGIASPKQLWMINALAVQVPAQLVPELAAAIQVDTVRLDKQITLDAGTPGSPSTAEWNITAVNADAVWSLGVTGEGVVVGSMDTGVDALHPDLATRWRGGNNSWFDAHGQHSEPYDANGHGTQTTSLMVGGDNSGNTIGMAPGAQWIAAKIFDDTGNSTTSAIHAGFQWMLDPDNNPSTDDAANVVNNSWNILSTLNQCDTEFQADIQALRAAGIAVVFSAGNNGSASSTSLSPANNAGSLAVGAVDEFMAAGYFSSRGPSACDGGLYPQLSAPGVNVRTADKTFGGVVLNSYSYNNGTSYSAAHVAGALALLQSGFPGSSLQQRESALQQTATDLGDTGADSTFGYGVIDVVAAYDTLANSNPGPVDADGDGVTADQDCNDNNASIYPGATEIKFDGVDQDCNGYDLTITITKATYTSKRDTLSVEATSDLGKDAALTLSGYGDLKWSSKKGVWSTSIRNAGGDPGAVTVTGVEGSESVSTSN